MTLITMFDPSSHRTSVSARLGPRILCCTNSPQTGFPCPLSTIVFFSPRYIGATQDLLRTSLLFRIHYPYTVHTVHTVLTRLLATHFPSKIKYSNGTGSWATWAATLLGTVQVLTGAPWAGRSSPAI